MALTLKRYQREALAALARFFALARGARDDAALDAAFRQTLLEQEHAAETIPPYLAQGFVSDEGPRPMSACAFPPAAARLCSVRTRSPPRRATTLAKTARWRCGWCRPT